MLIKKAILYWNLINQKGEEREEGTFYNAPVKKKNNLN